MSAYARSSFLPNSATERGSASMQYSVTGSNDVGASLSRQSGSIYRSSGSSKSFLDRKQGVKQVRLHASSCSSASATLPHDERAAIPASHTNLAFSNGSHSYGQNLFNQSFGQIAMDQNSDAEISQLTISQTLSGSQPSTSSHQQFHPRQAASFHQQAAPRPMSRSQEYVPFSQSTSETLVTHPSISRNNGDSVGRGPLGVSTTGSLAMAGYSNGRATQENAAPSRTPLRHWMKKLLASPKSLIAEKTWQEVPVASLASKTPQRKASIDAIQGMTPQLCIGTASMSSSSMSSSSRSKPQTMTDDDCRGLPLQPESVGAASLHRQPILKEIDEIKASLSEQMQNLEAKEKNLEKRFLEVNKSLTDCLVKIAREGDGWVEKLSLAAQDHASLLAKAAEGMLKNLTQVANNAATKVADARSQLIKSAFPYISEKVTHISNDLFRSWAMQRQAGEGRACHTDKLDERSDEVDACSLKVNLPASSDTIVSNGSNELPPPQQSEIQRASRSRRPKRVKNTQVQAALCSANRLSSANSEPVATPRVPPPAPSPRPVTIESSGRLVRGGPETSALVIQPRSSKQELNSVSDETQANACKRFHPETNVMHDPHIPHCAVSTKGKSSNEKDQPDVQGFGDESQLKRTVRRSPWAQASVASNTSVRENSGAENVPLDSSDCAGKAILLCEKKLNDDKTQAPMCNRKSPVGQPCIASSQPSGTFASSEILRDLTNETYLSDEIVAANHMVSCPKRQHDNVDKRGHTLGLKTKAPSKQSKSTTKSDLLGDTADQKHSPSEADKEGHVRRSRRIQILHAQPHNTSTSTCKPIEEKLSNAISDRTAEKKVPRKTKVGNGSQCANSDLAQACPPSTRTCKNSDRTTRDSPEKTAPSAASSSRPMSISDSSPSMACLESGAPRVRSTIVSSSSPSTTNRFLGSGAPRVRSTIVSSSKRSDTTHCAVEGHASSPDDKREQRMTAQFVAKEKFSTSDSQTFDKVSFFENGRSKVTPLADTFDFSVAAAEHPSVVYQSKATMSLTSKRSSRFVISQPKKWAKAQKRELTDATNTQASDHRTSPPKSLGVCSKIAPVTPNEKKRKSIPPFVSFPSKRSKTYGGRRQRATTFSDESFAFL